MNHTEASITISWQPPPLSADGSLCTDLAGYRIYYVADRSGSPYSGTGLAQGDSPVTLPLSSIADPSNPEFVISGLTAGATYYIAVTAYDTSSNESGYSNEIIAVDPAVNSPPAAAISASPTEGIAPLSVSFAGTGTDTDGTVTNYLWELGDGSGANAQNPVHTYITPGAYTVMLTVTDNSGATASAAKQISVLAPNVPPTASISAIPASGTAPLAVNFTAAATDSDGTIVSYLWNFGDGATSSSNNPSHTYSSAGAYTAKLTVTDNSGATASASKQIRVKPGRLR
ncbi:MAG: PKD domain-containing protein [bacterium]